MSCNNNDHNNKNNNNPSNNANNNNNDNDDNDNDNNTDQVAGGAEVVAVTGIGGWTPMETELLCKRVNDLAMPTLMDTIDGLETAVASLEAEKDQPYW